MLDEILDKCPDAFNIKDMMSRVEDRTPYIIVAFQECERMNILMSEIKRSLVELNLGLKVTYIVHVSSVSYTLNSSMNNIGCICKTLLRPNSTKSYFDFLRES